MTEILDSFDGGLKTSYLGILFNIYIEERISIENRIEYENFLKETYPEDYEDFLEFKSRVKAKTPNIKELIFDWLEGKTEIPELELFLV